MKYFFWFAKFRRKIKHTGFALKKRRPSYSFPPSTIIDRTNGFSGAELEQAVIEGMHISFSENRELMEKDLIKAVSELVPLSRTAKEQIDLPKNGHLLEECVLHLNKF